ncbi:hypothetical protein K2F54_04985 [Cryobacterium sp. 1639]|uniref:hypothetical protein n=1 Tax=Cryobacterium inferilacus TaxID=2866629 RepID=UPI001C72F14D|nr:hypothetical protein [Cryobacterium sp. 1639]MBX0299329.1 hypothetical protein [Cryobacterium sp. 1639]
MIVDLLLRLLARLLPPLARIRYLEEWRADAAGAAEAGLSRRDVLLGAAALSLTLDRDLPAHSGEARGTLPRRLARRGFALAAAAVVILFGSYFTGGGIVPQGEAATAGVVAALQTAGWLVLRLAVLLAVIAALYLAGAARVAATRTASVTLLAAILGPALVLAAALVPGLPAWLSAVGFLVIVAALAGGIVVLGGSMPIGLKDRTAVRRRRVPVAVLGAAAVIAVVVVGAIDLLVWNPEAKVPGTDLATIYALMASRDGFSLTTTAVLIGIWALFWSLAALIVLAAAAHPRAAALTPRRLAIVLLGLVGGAIFFRFFAGFGIGMSIADSFMTSGGDVSVVSAVLPYVGQLALAGAAVAFGWAPRLAPRQPAPA